MDDVVLGTSTLIPIEERAGEFVPTGAGKGLPRSLIKGRQIQREPLMGLPMRDSIVEISFEFACGLRR